MAHGDIWSWWWHQFEHGKQDFLGGLEISIPHILDFRMKFTIFRMILEIVFAPKALSGELL